MLIFFMSIIVTGGAGFIGSHAVDALVRMGFSIKVIDNFSSGRMENLSHHLGNPRVTISRLDLKDGDLSRELRGATAVLHFAANPEVRVSTTNPDIHFRENVVATFNLLEAMRISDVGELVFASSSSVYGEPPEIPVPENAPIRPVSVYGASKASGENLIHAYSKLYGIRAVAMRYANVAGPRLRHGVVPDLMLKLAKNPRQLEILGDGTQVRSYIYVEDAVEATILAWQRSKSSFEAFNVGSEDWVTVNDIARLIIKELGLTGVGLTYKPVMHGVGWPGDVKKIALSIDKLKSIGFKPRHNSMESLELTIRALRSELGVNPQAS